MKKKIRNNDLVLTTVHKDKKCPSCGKRKDILVHLLHKNILKQKRVFELFLCTDCIQDTRNRIINDKAKDYFYLIPIFNSMLQAANIPIAELSIDQIAELMNEDSKKEDKIIEGEIINEVVSKEK